MLTWTRILIIPILTIVTLMILGSAAEPGLCYDGIPNLLAEYPGAKIAYNPTPNQGHVWIITTNGQPIDTYYGPQSGPEWSNPTYLLNSMEELDAKISELTGYKECENTKR